MIYTVLFYSAFVSLFAFGGVVYFLRNAQKSVLVKIITTKMVDKPLFSSLVARDLAAWILHRPKKQKEFILKNISQGLFKDVFPALPELLQTKLRLILQNKLSSSDTKDFLYTILEGLFFANRRQFDKASALALRPLKKREPAEIRALKKLLLAKIALYEGDLQSVTDEISTALRVFRRKKMFSEEAEACFVMGTAYRITGVYDTADFMLRAAAEIYQNLNALTKLAEVFGTLGLLMSAQHRFDEASSYYQKALRLLSPSAHRHLYYFIVLQQAMSALEQNAPQKALRLAQKALKGHTLIEGKSFAAEVLARGYFETKKWRAAFKWACFSANLSFRKKNYAAAFECLYLAAESLIAEGEDSQAESLLRDLIAKEKYHKSCFHVANAYTLLGLVLMKKGDIKGAKTLFNQSLKQELYNDRNVGAAIDYMNLAAVERKCGNLGESRKNLEHALLYAKDHDDSLRKTIESFLN